MKKEEKVFASYILGIVGLVLAFLQPLAGIVLGIIGLVMIKGEKTDLKKNAKLLNILSLVVGIIVFGIFIWLNFYYYKGQLQAGLM